MKCHNRDSWRTHKQSLDQEWSADVSNNPKNSVDADRPKWRAPVFEELDIAVTEGGFNSDDQGIDDVYPTAS